MIGSGEKAYAFAKASGIIGKSFVGRRTAALGPINRLSEFDRLVFGANAKELPEKELLSDMEQRLSRRSVTAISSVIKSFKNPPLLFTLLLRVYEYSDLKTALALIAEGETSSRPAFTLLGNFGTVNFDAWPDANAMLAGTDLTFILKYLSPSEDDTGEVSMETALDRHYYSKLWTSLQKLKIRDCRAAKKIIGEEIALLNCSWVLRLRHYYGMKAGEVAEHLIVMDKNKTLCEDAKAALEFSLDDYHEWEQWKRRKFLNPLPDTGHWHADPRYFQNAASVYLYRLAMRYFRTSLSFIDKIFCFIMLKQHEEDLLTSNAEGLGMGLSSREVLSLLGAAS